MATAIAGADKSLMAYSPVSIARRHVLGSLYSRCNPIESIPVYLKDEDGEKLGHVDQGLGHYADAFSFHLAEDICKRLSSGQFAYSFSYEYAEGSKAGDSGRRIQLSCICLTPLSPPVKAAVPKSTKPEAVVEK
jgi:hypothetical protein